MIHGGIFASLFPQFATFQNYHLVTQRASKRSSLNFHVSENKQQGHNRVQKMSTSNMSARLFCLGARCH
jgi:hypothetical protein